MNNIARPDNEADLICEALVKEIGRAPRLVRNRGGMAGDPDGASNVEGHGR